MEDDGQLVISRPQAIYFYNIEGRGACFAFNENHHHLASTGRNLIVVRHVILTLFLIHVFVPTLRLLVYCYVLCLCLGS